MIEYAKLHNIPVSATPKEPWSTDANIMHISYESGILEDPGKSAPKDLYKMTSDPQDLKTSAQSPIYIDVFFQCGLPVNVIDMKTKKSYLTPYDILTYLNEIGGQHGVGRIDIVENRFVGLKVMAFK